MITDADMPYGTVDAYMSPQGARQLPGISPSGQRRGTRRRTTGAGRGRTTAAHPRDQTDRARAPSSSTAFEPAAPGVVQLNKWRPATRTTRIRIEISSGMARPQELRPPQATKETAVIQDACGLLPRALMAAGRRRKRGGGRGPAQAARRGARKGRQQDDHPPPHRRAPCSRQGAPDR